MKFLCISEIHLHSLVLYGSPNSDSCSCSASNSRGASSRLWRRVWCLCSVPLLGCYGRAGWRARGSIAGCHCWVPWLGGMFGCHVGRYWWLTCLDAFWSLIFCWMPCQGVMFLCWKTNNGVYAGFFVCFLTFSLLSFSRCIGHMRLSSPAWARSQSKRCERCEYGQKRVCSKGQFRNVILSCFFYCTYRVSVSDLASPCEQASTQTPHQAKLWKV